MTTKIPVELSSTPGIVDESNATAITIDSSENSTFAGNIIKGNLTISGTEIDLSSGDLTIDVAGGINLDSDGGEISFKDAGTEIGKFNNSSSDFAIEAGVQDKDILFKGNDGGSGITAVTIDMSVGGQIQGSALGVANPTFSFDNDTDTGMTRPTADTLQFVCGGTVKNRISSDGLLFNSDTAAANALDDYEEGTWTPVLTRVSAPNIAFTVEEANYTKIGRMVTVQMGLLITGVTAQGSSVTFVDGLPFNNGGIAYSSTGSVGMNSAFASECHVCQIGGNSDNTINFHADNIGFANLATDFTNGGRLYCSLTYEAS